MDAEVTGRAARREMWIVALLGSAQTVGFALGVAGFAYLIGKAMSCG